MNSSRFDRVLHQVLLVPVLAVLLGAAAVAFQIHEANLTVANIALSDQRIAETLTIENLIIDQETGLRGFQTTRDPRFLEPYFDARRRLPAAFQHRASIATSEARREAIFKIQQFHDTWEGGFAAPLIASIQGGADTSDVDLNLGGKRLMDQLRKEIANQNAYTIERRDQYTHDWKNQVRFMIVALLVLAGAIGALIGLFGRRLMHQVSDAYRASHEALRVRAEQTFQSEQRLRTTLQSIGDGVIACDADGRIESMNQVACELTGWSEEEARTLPLTDVFHIVSESDRAPVENPVDKVKRLDRIVSLSNHTILIRRDNSEIFVDDSGAPIRDKQGELVGVVLVFRDVTLAKKSQEALLSNEKLAVAGRLAATIAHEIHNPLDSVTNLLFLLGGPSSPEENQHFIELARQELARVTHITRAMLSLYSETTAPVPLNIRELFDSILLVMERRLRTNSVTIEAQVPETLNIRGFPAELRQVFSNLLLNAAEAASPNGRIRVTARPAEASEDANGRPSPSGIVVTIQDQGPGIPDKIRPELFKPFVSTKSEPGSGLGLWVSRGILTRHGGTIELDSSTAPDTHGTTVSVFLASDPFIHAAR